MRKIIITAIAVCLAFLSCRNNQKHDVRQETPKDGFTIEPVSDSMMENAVIYEANIRQYSPEGTFNAFAKDIPTLKQLGVQIIWVMPINPISKIKRKATGDKFTSDIEDENERKKYLGSYYSVSDYKAINPEFGTLDDFKNLVKTAHENGIYVIVDWVPNHTGWDHPWIANHPDYYTQNDRGEIIDPINPDTGESWGWTDVADLNYDNQAMRNDMITDLKYWITEANIDGYRMDVAHKVPVDFFETVTAELNTIKPVFMLAEAEQPNLLLNAFDMQYAWEGHHIFNEMAKGNMTVKDFDAYMVKLDSILEKDDINMNFITNHDENSWNGTLKERMPDSKDIFTALSYTMPGMPLIYSGQEYDLSHRLKFFEKDSIPKTKGNYFGLLEKLGALKHNNPALNGGKQAATYKRLNSEDNVLLFERKKGGHTIIFAGNFSEKPQQVVIPQGVYLDYISNIEVEFNGSPLDLGAWAYKILVLK
ncbi:MAG: alpha-amylase family glycosyl hydrolase [Flavobacteriaceae bacterium]